MSRWLSRVSGLRQHQHVHLLLVSPPLQSCSTSSTSSCRMVRRGRDFHLHGQAFAAQGAWGVGRVYERRRTQAHDLQTRSDEACWCHVISNLGRVTKSGIGVVVLLTWLVLFGMKLFDTVMNSTHFPRYSASVSGDLLRFLVLWSSRTLPTMLRKPCRGSMTRM